MSDIRLTPSVPAPQTSPGSPSGPPAAVRNAQAAFFRAAMDAAQAAPVARPTPTTMQTEAQPAEPRTPRPGALLDIRV